MSRDRPSSFDLVSPSLGLTEPSVRRTAPCGTGDGAPLSPSPVEPASATTSAPAQFSEILSHWDQVLQARV